MKIKLLHAVLHDGDVLEPGVIADIAELAAVSLVAAGAAEEVEEPDAPEPAKTDPAGTPDTGAAKTDTGAEAAANTTADAGKTKAAKTAEGK
jgi:hypothetical protein